jgi:hypothetical protein
MEFSFSLVAEVLVVSSKTKFFKNNSFYMIIQQLQKSLTELGKSHQQHYNKCILYYI